MDNEAFRALVQERTKVKSTKEIAREAVEEEFRTRKKRQRGGSSSEEDYSDDEDDQPHDPPAQQNDWASSASANRNTARSSTKNEASKYRDRAKERREGKNVDYQAQASLMDGVAAAAALEDGEMDRVTMSKYLGGDESHTHLVKGLDVALARRVKREMTKDMEHSGVERNLLPTRESESAKDAVGVAISASKEEALALLRHFKLETVTSELGRQMLAHLKTVHIPVVPSELSEVTVKTSSAGLALQRSNLTFASFGDPRDRNRAWEVPLESMQAATNKSDSATLDTETNGATQLDVALLRQVRYAFSRRQSENAAGTRRQAIITQDSARESGKDQDEDEDIFNDADEYVPSTKHAKCKSSSLPTKRNVSIFEGLEVPKPPSSQHSDLNASNTPDQKASATTHEAISRDVLESTSRKHASNTISSHGVSMLAYEGGYGEEMDVDFDGRFAVEEDQGKKKRKVKHKGTTTQDN